MPPRAVAAVMSRSIGDGLLQLGQHGRPLWAASTASVYCVVRRTGVEAIIPPGEGHRLWWTAGLVARLSKVPTRAFSARALDGVGYVDHSGHVDHVLVPCASSGNIIVSLYNVHEHLPTTPLLLYLPPSPEHPLEGDEGGDTGEGEDAQETAHQPERVLANLQPPPGFLLRQNFPIAAIRYRWSTSEVQNGQDVVQDPDQLSPRSYLWPTPLHDVLFAYDWIKKHLSPPLSASTRSLGERRHFLRRDLYVYGSYLGAGLATSLALTETHPQHRVAIRGVAAYNGIFNWTAYVGMTADGIPVADDADAVHNATPGIRPLPLLFRKPPDLFDAFASPSLFFRTTGHLIAPLDLDKDVGRRLLEEKETRLEEEEGKEGQGSGQALGRRTVSMEMLGMSRKAYLAFPPLRSTLSIPSALFLHTSVPAPPSIEKRTRTKKQGNSASAKPRKIPEAANGNNSFAIQADEIACLMRRGIDKVEIKRQREQQPVFLSEYTDNRFDESEADVQTGESEQRVRIAGVDAPADSSLELGEDGQEILIDWLDEHMSNNPA